MSQSLGSHMLAAKVNWIACIMAEGVLSREFRDFIVSVGDDYTPPKVLADVDIIQVIDFALMV